LVHVFIPFHLLLFICFHLFHLLQEQLDCDLLVFSPHPSLARFLADALPAGLGAEARAQAVATAW
jgi:hypothetical protein